MSTQTKVPKSSARHPNRIPFEGVMTRLDVPSDKAPSGSKGHRVVLTSAAAEAALDSLIGMAVSYKANWDGHDARQKCGVIDNAYIKDAAGGAELRVSGYIYARDFPEVETAMGDSNKPLGMSYELADAHVEDMRSAIWTLDRVTFTGAAILLRDKAAYKSTTIALLTAATERFNGKLRFRKTGAVKILKQAPKTAR